MMEGGSTTLAAVPSESSAMAAGLLAAAVVGGLLCMVAGKLFCHRSYPETPSESDSAAAGVLRPPEPLLEVLATSAVAGKVAVDLPELLAATGAVAGSVRNRSCFILLFRAVCAAAEMCGAVL
ncbi:uncharacterized protein [Arachis hypogaea]|uniref:Uncharacterized protein n=1 Tax=Arachis hypogaea TaxID=3818 RepID=A0A6B9V8F7_ARAHY|nr:uncharacterized protein LOC112776679 [Arachis hypogaea]QHN77537.1 uncharacterized protein DS421_19g653600 [Arachis hypogaea]